MSVACRTSRGTQTAARERSYNRCLMPIYEYRRPDGSTFEITQSFSDETLTHDPETGVKVERVLHAPAVHFKGKGFYNTDYGTRNRQRENAAAAESSSKGSSNGSGAEGKSEKSSGSSESGSASASSTESKPKSEKSGEKASASKSDAKPAATKK
jgi:putative FmdB family regulatory protein